ncbi:MAG: hypothetical protein WCH65_08495, partial [bacterium]
MESTVSLANVGHTPAIIFAKWKLFILHNEKLKELILNLVFFFLFLSSFVKEGWYEVPEDFFKANILSYKSLCLELVPVIHRETSPF